MYISNTIIEELKQKQVDRQRIELVAHKSTGHHGSICDAITEEISIALCHEYLATFGRILHHNIDKGLLVAERTKPHPGGRTVLAPMRLVFEDRATADRINWPMSGKFSHFERASYLIARAFNKAFDKIILRLHHRPGGSMTVNAVESLALSPCGLATGIGSLPFTEPTEALAMIKRYLPAIPHWPQLPLRGSVESFVHQFLQALVDMGILETTPQKIYFNTSVPAWPDRLTEFYSVYLAAEEGDRDALQRFAAPEISAPGFYAFLDDIKKTGVHKVKYLKGHMVGPLTAGFQLQDEHGRLAYYQEQLRDLIVKTLAMHARWQAAALSSLGRPVILFIDEPCVGACGSCYHITLTREMILEDLNAILSAAHKENAITGVHSCHAVDWSILFESDLEIVSLDAYRFGKSLISYNLQMERFLERGGIMAWGIVPTLEEAFEENAGSLLEHFEALRLKLVQCGVDGKRLQTQSLITPACGTGLLSPELAERIYRLTREVSTMVGADREAATHPMNNRPACISDRSGHNSKV